MRHIKEEQDMLHAHSLLLERFHSIQSLRSLPPVFFQTMDVTGLLLATKPLRRKELPDGR